MDCGIATIGGNAAGGGASAPPRTLFAISPDVDSTSVFPVITTMVSAAIPANTLRSDGDMLRFQFEGNVLNAGAGAATFAPFLGIDAVFAWGAPATSAIPNTGVAFSWHCFGLITRKSALTYTAGGLFYCNNVTTALTGIGSLALANQGGPFSAPDANPACNWGNAQNFIFNMSASIAGTRWRIKGGCIDPPLYRP